MMIMYSLPSTPPLAGGAFSFSHRLPRPRARDNWRDLGEARSPLNLEQFRRAPWTYRLPRWQAVAGVIGGGTRPVFGIGRREFISLLGGAAAARSRRARNSPRWLV